MQTSRKPSSKTLAGTGRKAIEPGTDFLPGLLKLGGQFLAIGTQSLAQIGLKGGDRAPGQRDRDQHLHQKSDTKGNKDRPQQAAS
ncbi:hypothetical protein D9M73_273490 [compost metagenome]